MSSQASDILTINSYYRNKLKACLTYLIHNGQFNQARTLIESTSNTDLNETDEWWLNDPNVLNFSRKKNNSTLTTSAYVPALPLVTSTQTSIQYLRLSLKDKLTSRSRSKYGRTALMYCSLIEDNSWSYSIAQNLIEKGAKLGLRDSHGYNALMYACLYERVIILNLFLSSPGDYSLLTKDKYGNTCFHLASLSKSEHVCDILRQICAKFSFDPLTNIGKNCFGHKPFELCKMNRHENCVKKYYFSLLLKNRKRDSIVLQHDTNLHSQSMQNLNQNQIPLIRIIEPELSLNDDIASKVSHKIQFMASSISFERPLFKTSTESLHTQETSSSTRESAKFYFNHLSMYKFINAQKEPLIKANETGLRMFSERKVINDYVDFCQNENVPKCVITRNLGSFDQSELIKSERERTWSERSRPSPSMKVSSDIDLEKPWKQNMKNLYETIEFQSSKSFRKANTNMATNLFEQLTAGLLINVHLNACLLDDNARRSSMLRNKENSRLSNRSSDRRQSISNGSKSLKQSRRTSVMSIKS